jgi:hypothetical protein
MGVRAPQGFSGDEGRPHQNEDHLKEFNAMEFIQALF